MLHVKNLRKSFENQILFSDLNFDINTGDIVCITAESGKGKTTLLKILMGLERFDSGEIHFSKLQLNETTISTIRKAIAWLPQDLSILIKTGEELIDLLEIEKDIFVHYLNNLGLEEKILQQDFHSVSGGQKQRILISACLSQQKTIIFLDEPTSALDKTSINQLIKTIQTIKGITIISVSHNPDWINSCNKTIQL